MGLVTPAGRALHRLAIRRAALRSFAVAGLPRQTRQNRTVLRPTKRYSGPPLGSGNLPRSVRRLLEAAGGIVSTAELRSLDVDTGELAIYRVYAALQAVRQGWHCLPATADVVRLAWRFGGPLACVSALAFHDALEGGALEGRALDIERLIEQPLHVCLPANTPRVPNPRLLARRWGIDEPLAPVIHWSTVGFRSGDRRAVSRDVALQQANRCDARAHPAARQS